MLGLEVVDSARKRDRLLHQGGDDFRAYGNAPVRVRLLQSFDSRPIVAVVQTVDDPELRLVHDALLEHLSDHRSNFVADARRVEPRRRNDKHQGVLALAGRSFDHVVDGSRLVSVQLINDGQVSVQAVEGRAFCGLRLKGRIAGRHVERVRQHLKPELVP